jgi:hypothetical protein
MGKAGGAPPSVSAHFRLASVGIKETPLKIGLLGRFNKNKTVCPNGDPSLADFPGKFLHAIDIDDRFSMIDEDKIIPAAADLHKRNLHTASSMRQGNALS